MTTFAIVIAAYRAEDFIAEAIESALSQSRPADEIVVVDDCSPDGQEAVIARYARHIKQIRLSRNQGEAAAKNAGVDEASSEYVVLLDADDWWSAGRLAAIEDLLLQDPDADIVTTDAWVETAGEPAYRYYTPGFWPHETQRTAIIRNNFVFSHAAVRRSRWQSIGGMDASRPDAGGDWPLWVRLILRGSKAALVDDPLAHYRIHGGNLTSSSMLNARTKEAAMQAALSTPGLSAIERRLAKRSLRQARYWKASVDTFVQSESHRPPLASALRVAVSRFASARDRGKALGLIVAPSPVRSLIERNTRGNGGAEGKNLN